jgi:F-type H+-transporting ATPase subunit gamma
MPSLRDIRKHIKAVKNIKQITYAMKMVASARIKKAQNQILSFKPYSNYLEDVISDLSSEFDDEKLYMYDFSRFLKRRENTGNIGIVVVSGDKGLCGAFNNNILLNSIRFIKSNNNKNIYLIAVGKKSVDFFKKLKNINLYYQISNIFPKVNYTHAFLLGQKVIEMYDKYNLESVYFIYMEFKSILKQELKNVSILPIVKNSKTQVQNKRSNDVFIFEPSKKDLLENLIPKYINIEIFRILLENQASELASRMNAMEQASKNASELIDELTVKMNKLRQAQITTELNEIISGANAISG